MIASQAAFEMHDRAIQDLFDLNAKGVFTKRDEQRQANLMSQIAGLKAGMSAGEVKRIEQDRILKAAGLPRLPDAGARRGFLNEEVETEYRKFFRGEEVRATFRPPDSAVRANLGGTESITFTQSTGGGTFVAQGMYDRAFASAKQYDQIFEDWASNVFETPTGGATPVPSWDDVASASVQVGESSQSTEVDVAAFGSVNMNAWAFRSKVVAISIELLQDSNFPLPTLLERIFALRHARGVGAALVTGSGVNSPTGLVTGAIAAGAAIVVAAGSAANTGGSETGSTSVGTSDLNKLFHALDPAYRSGAVWYMSDTTLSYIEGLLDKSGRPIVHYQGLSDPSGSYPCIYRRRVAICPSIPSMASGHNSIVFANPAYFIQRRVPSSMYVRRFQEKPGLVENGLAGFESWLRVDSGLVAPNSSFVPAAVLQNHS